LQDDSSDPMSLFRPPIIRSAGAILDRSLFTKRVPIAAARVLDVKNISRFRAQLEKSKDALRLERLINVRPDPDPALASKGGKCLLLKPEVKPEGIYNTELGCRLAADLLQFQKHGVQVYKRLSGPKSSRSSHTLLHLIMITGPIVRMSRVPR